ncbi:hypothetical protein [Rhizobium leguminosarum]|uniref:hypothetical protein n=1 Tax=Rhizobium leguminosarum TaxID=384 RepID=UPI003F9C25F4
MATLFERIEIDRFTTTSWPMTAETSPLHILLGSAILKRDAPNLRWNGSGETAIDAAFRMLKGHKRFGTRRQGLFLWLGVYPDLFRLGLADVYDERLR